MGFAVFKTRPESEDVTAALDRIILTVTDFGGRDCS